jgi:peptidyl-prolyl cis-trans isomerase SurA
MKKITLILLVLIISASSFNKLKAQGKDPVLLTIGNETITKSEFEKVFRKNNKSATIDQKALTDYLDLFINYKLKVKEAVEMGMDTASSFVSELAGYRKQLAQPYLVDKEVTDKLLHEAYDRMQKDVHVSHILIKCASDALPKDTLEAYNRALKIRERIMKGEDFGKVAKETSEDPSAKDNLGDLGFFSAMQMVYSFESAAFNAKVGEVTMPIRTKFGYHIIKKIDERKDAGEVTVAHIMAKCKDCKPEDSAKAVQKINEISEKLKNGGNFEELCKQYSDDQGSSKNGGVLPAFKSGRMVPEFENAAFALKNKGDISQPIRSPYGWHIIKLINRKPIGTYDEMLGELKANIAKDSRSEVGKTSMVNKIKKDYKFKDDSKAVEDFYNVVDSTLVQGKWDASKASSLNKTMFTLLDKKYTQKDFAKYITEHQTSRKNTSPQAIINSMYDQFVIESCLGFEESRLDLKYPEFKDLMTEYKDGILLFNLTDKKVWSKAVKDTVGLQDYYNSHKSNYTWGQRLEGAIYNCSSDEVATKVRELLMDKRLTNDSIVSIINSNSQLNLSVKEGKFSRGDNQYVDTIKWVKGVSNNIPSGKSIIIVNVKDILPPQPKTLEDARGSVTADFQALLEKEWIKSLRSKYPYKINQEVLAQIK